MSAGNPVAPNPVSPRIYVGASINVPTVAASLLSLVQALTGYGDTPAVWSEVTLQNDPQVPSTQTVDVGDSAVSPTHKGYVLTVGQSKTYPNGADISRIYVVAGSAGGVLNVELNLAGPLRW